MRIGRKTWAAQVAAIGLGAACAGWSAASDAQSQPSPAQPSPAQPSQEQPPQAQPSQDKSHPASHHGGISRTDSSGKVVPIVFSADEVTYDDPLGVIIARGNVEISQAGQTVLADVVAYNERTDTVTASGHVTITRTSGEIIHAEYADLTDQLNDGFIQDIRTMLADRSRLVGNTARRTGNGNRTEIRKGVYSPCDLCKDDPNAPPLWQLQAETIIHNKEQQLVEYKDVSLDIDGWPVLYSPYLSHPDPTVKRSSGFLPPSIGESTFLGGFVKIPYYWVLDEDSDLTFAPMFTTTQGPVAEGEYRQRFGNGELYVQGSFTNGQLAKQQPGSDLLTYQNNQDRGDIDAWGQWDLTDQLRTGFMINRTSDQTYLQLYRLGGYQAFLTSRAYIEDFDGRNYGAINSYDFQSLQSNVSDHTQPIVLPSLQYTWDSSPMPWGGKFTTSVSGIDLIRETGSDARRLTAETQFDYPFFGPWGERFNFVAGLRGDNYEVSRVQERSTVTLAQIDSAGPLINQVVPTGPAVNGFAGRIFPQVGLEWNWPWITRGERSSFVIEPRIAFYAAPNGENPNKIANNDSQAIDFNDTDLFVRNRFVGYDLVDSGQRVDYGLQAAWHIDTGESLTFLAGQSYRFEKSSPFAGQTYKIGNQPPIQFGYGDGLVRQLSDYVGRVVYSPSQSLDFSYRYRFDQQDLRPQMQEVGVSTGTETVRVGTSLIQLGNNLADNESHRMQIGVNLNVQLDQYWSVSANATRDLSGDGNLVASGLGLQYSDECLTFLTTFQQDGYRFGGITPGQAIVFTLVLKNLGVIGVPALETGGL